MSLLVLLAICWLLVSLLGYYLVTKTFQSYANHPQFPVPPHYQAFMRKDFGKWN